MDEQEKQMAKTHAVRATTQAKHAARNGLKATREVAEGVAEDVVEEAQDQGKKFVGTAQDAAKASKRLSPSVIGFIASETGQGFLGVAVAIGAGMFAAHRFQAAKNSVKGVIQQ